MILFDSKPRALNPLQAQTGHPAGPVFIAEPFLQDSKEATVTDSFLNSGTQNTKTFFVPTSVGVIGYNHWSLKQVSIARDLGDIHNIQIL